MTWNAFGMGGRFGDDDDDDERRPRQPAQREQQPQGMPLAAHQRGPQSAEQQAPHQSPWSAWAAWQQGPQQPAQPTAQAQPGVQPTQQQQPQAQQPYRAPASRFGRPDIGRTLDTALAEWHAMITGQQAGDQEGAAYDQLANIDPLDTERRFGRR